MLKTDDVIKRDIAFWERLADVGGALVVLGIVIEAAQAAMHADGTVALEKWLPTATNALIALGVAAEILFSRRARSRSEELQRRSDEKIADLKLQIAEAHLSAKSAQNTADTAQALAYLNM